MWVIHPFFEIDPEWTEAKLYPADQSCEVYRVREEAMNAKKTPKSKRSAEKQGTKKIEVKSPSKLNAGITKTKAASPIKKGEVKKRMVSGLTATEQRESRHSKRQAGH